ncbi:GNAT family N-acetyltransferase [Maritalea myrionectae]|uniref:GNAT family N-acetyltransferase n=1 Tax=Maritalea myrionectae TaxID=454601 RepID=UPI000567413E|nr:GNAT family N-acetyltransferase [Maritalea myrionectae]
MSIVVTFEIRRALVEDKPDIKGILLSTFTHTWKPQLNERGLAKAAQFDQRVDDYLDQYCSHIFVAAEGGKAIGMVHWFGDFVAALHVSQEAQGRGAGSALLCYVENEIRQAHDKVRLETDTFNTQSRAFYKKHGFEEIKQYPDEEWDSGLTTILLCKRLS